MNVVNAGGSGARTTADGIMVVQATNGATTAGGAFALNSRVAAGAYEYYLFKGGVSAGTQDNWYLRSTIVPGSGAVAGAPDPLQPNTTPEAEAPDITGAPPASQLPPTPLPTEEARRRSQRTRRLRSMLAIHSRLLRPRHRRQGLQVLRLRRPCRRPRSP